MSKTPLTAALAIAAALVAAMSAAWAAPSAAKLPAKEDVGVRSTAPDTNYASSIYLYAGTASTAMYRSYLKFDLSTLPDGAKVQSAKLTVWSRRVAADGTAISLFAAGDGWSEGDLKWSNAPAPEGSALARTVLPLGSAPVAHTWDVSAYVAAEAEGDKVVTVVLAESAPPQGTWAWFADSKDGTVPGASLDLEVEEAPPADVTPPTIGLEVLKDKLWPPNHEMVLCAVVSVTDDIDGAPVVGNGDGPVVTNSEAAQATGSGQTDPDVEVKKVGDLKWEVWLRAERAGTGEGREYKIEVSAKDATGNESVKDGAVVVPHDQGNGKQKGS